MELSFQGWGLALQRNHSWHISEARSFFNRALSADPQNVGALIGISNRRLPGASGFVANPVAAFAAAEAKLTKALSSAPDHAFGHAMLGNVEMVTKRAAEGIAECEHALELNPNLAGAYSFIGLGEDSHRSGRRGRSSRSRSPAIRWPTSG
jgi:hypothetical protein